MLSRMRADDSGPAVAVDYPAVSDDDQEGKIIQWTVDFFEDFRKREQDFVKRQGIQEKRRLFYVSNREAHPLENLVHLQNK